MPGGIGDRTAVVAGRNGNDPTLLLVGRQTEQFVGRSPKLERSGGLLVLQLEMNAGRGIQPLAPVYLSLQ